LNRAVFLDRDGVINRAIVRNGRPYPPSTLAELEVLPGVPDALEKLHAAGFVLIVVTNQPDVARGIQTREVVEEMNETLKKRLPIDEFRVCYHDSVDHCRCRKPQPGAIVEAAEAWDVDLRSSFLVGDRWRDIEAGQRAGCTALFIDYGYDEKYPEEPFVRVASVSEAAEYIIVDRCAIR
jgi:D-glycero-D-manno-heptose 1,7-bisphosphate phosphatase